MFDFSRALTTGPIRRSSIGEHRSAPANPLSTLHRFVFWPGCRPPSFISIPEYFSAYPHQVAAGVYPRRRHRATRFAGISSSVILLFDEHARARNAMAKCRASCSLLTTFRSPHAGLSRLAWARRRRCEALSRWASKHKYHAYATDDFPRANPFCGLQTPANRFIVTSVRRGGWC